MTPEDSTSRWRTYYAKTGDRPAHRTVLFALSKFREEGRKTEEILALDLGSGAGRDAIELSREGIDVIAIDYQEEAIEAMLKNARLQGYSRIAAIQGDFTKLPFPEVDLVVSSFALPLCLPTVFPEVWVRLVKCVKTNGRIAVHFFGPRDSWAKRSGITILDRDQALNYLSGLVVEMFEEEETDTVTPKGEHKHWHIFHIVAKKSIHSELDY